MIGYLKPKIDDLRVYEYKQYRSFYCGLCVETKKNLGELERLLLSNDMTFFAILLTSVSHTDTKNESHRCSLHGYKKKEIRTNKYTSFMADIGFLFAYTKFQDNIIDEKDLKSTAASLVYKRKYYKTIKKYPIEYEHIKYYTEKLHELEASNCTDYHMLGNLFGDTLAFIFRPLCTEQTEQTIQVIQYIGQWIYCIDALEDLDEDKENKRYNPLLPQYEANPTKLLKEIADHINSILLQIVYLYTDMEFYDYKGIVFNTLCISIREKSDAILKKYHTSKEISNEAE